MEAGSTGVAKEGSLPGSEDDRLETCRPGASAGRSGSYSGAAAAHRLVRLVVRNDASYDESCARGAPPGGGLARGGEHTGTAPPRALGLHARLDHRSLPHFTNPCHLSAHRCWPRVEDIHLSPQLAPRVLQRFITGAVHPRQLQCGYGPQGPEMGLSVLTETSQGLTSRLADLGARRPHPRHYVAAGGDQRSSQHSDQRSGQRSDQRNSQRKPAGRRSTASPAQQLKKHIVACFDNLRGGPRAAELDVIVRENRGAMTPASAITLMHRCAKTLKDRNRRSRVDVKGSKEELSAQAVGNAAVRAAEHEQQ
ncbi:hypothetical protein CYMTET_14803 [Cymbomonas tetramitiformis]|uniref:Uncharacterized protein n=1 Tax=Cymbomonas tetramitiformis TaxID=36881 RepID=A0AAE0GFJ6_9CHLO|nr:hypothetical protein CYMTET_14803 [Cymbomonas tetramitiformis]